MTECVKIVRLRVTFDHSCCQGLVYNRVQVLCITIATRARVQISVSDQLSAQYISTKQTLDDASRICQDKSSTLQVSLLCPSTNACATHHTGWMRLSSLRTKWTLRGMVIKMCRGLVVLCCVWMSCAMLGIALALF